MVVIEAQKGMTQAIPAEALSLKAKNLCICVKVVKNENYSTLRQMTRPQKTTFVQKLMEEVQREWQRAPFRILVGRNNTQIVVNDKVIETTPFLLQFVETVERNQTRFRFQAGGFEYEGFFRRYGEGCGSYIEDIFTADFSIAEKFRYLGNQLVLEEQAPHVTSSKPPKEKKVLPQKIVSKKKVRDVVRRSLSNQEKIQKLEGEIHEINQEIERLEEQAEIKDATIEELERIYRRYTKKN